MIVESDYQRTSLEDLIQYIKRDRNQRVPVRDDRGRELDNQRLDDIIEKSREHQFERHMIIAPDPRADFATREVSRNTRMAMREWERFRSRADWVYAVHGREAKPHSHVAITGPESHLRMNQQSLDRFSEKTREIFREQERLPEREAEAEKDREQIAERDLSILGDEATKAETNGEATAEAERDPESDPAVDADAEREQTRERSRNWGGGR